MLNELTSSKMSNRASRASLRSGPRDLNLMFRKKKKHGCRPPNPRKRTVRFKHEKTRLSRRLNQKGELRTKLEDKQINTTNNWKNLKQQKHKT